MSQGKKPNPLSENKIPLLTHHSSRAKTIWSIGGGKGGTGKTFISACLGIELANLNQEVVLIDADLGGPNLHTFLGMKEAPLDLGHFITNKVNGLDETALATPYPYLKLVKGTENLLFAANLNYYKKLKLIRHIKGFENKRVIVDIGTGAAYNTVDFFILSNPGVIVINPEPTSIENAYYFLKSCIVRIFKLYIDYYQIQDFIKNIAEQIHDTSKSVYSFLNEIISRDRTYAQVFFTALKHFRPTLIINKARDEKDLLLGESMIKVVQKYLVIDLDFLGIIPFDEKVHLSLKEKKPFLEIYPDSAIAQAIKEITQKLLQLSPDNAT